MNAYTKMILIPEDEYNKLKSSTRDKISYILDRPLPPQMIENQVNRHLDSQQSMTPLITQPITQITPSDSIDEYKDFDSADFSWDPAVIGVTPKRPPILQQLKDKYTPRGRVINSSQKPIPGSNINTVMQYLESDDVGAGPSGYKTIARALQNIGEEAVVVNPKGREAMTPSEALKELLHKAEERQKTRFQSGKGWSSIKKF